MVNLVLLLDIRFGHCAQPSQRYWVPTVLFGSSILTPTSAARALPRWTITNIKVFTVQIHIYVTVPLPC